jgi:membrane protein required for colicin V production
MFIDTLCIILLITACIKGYSRGLIVAVFSFFAIFLGILAAVKLSAVVANYLQEHAKLSLQFLPFIAFALVMISVAILVKFLAKIIEKTAEFVLMGWINKAGGILLYGLLYFSVLSVSLFYLTHSGIIGISTVESSSFYKYIEPLGPKTVNAVGHIIPIFKNLFIQLNNFFTVVAASNT